MPLWSQNNTSKSWNEYVRASGPPASLKGSLNRFILDHLKHSFIVISPIPWTVQARSYLASEIRRNPRLRYGPRLIISLLHLSGTILTTSTQQWTHIKCQRKKLLPIKYNPWDIEIKAPSRYLDLNFFKSAYNVKESEIWSSGKAGGKELLTEMWVGLVTLIPVSQHSRGKGRPITVSWRSA